MTARVSFLKIGGSCLTGADALGNLSDIAARAAKCVIVVSAFEGVTDALMRVYNDERENLGHRVNELGSLHASWLAEALGRCPAEASLKSLSRSMNPHPYIESAWDDSMLPLEDLPSILSIGERLSAATCTAYLAETGYDATFIPSDLLGLIACRSDSGYLPDTKASAQLIRNNVNKALEGSDFLVTTGFFALDLSGKIQTFGRNSSDLSAVAFAGAYGSSHITLYKDVNGIYNVDPKSLADRAFLYEVLTHDAAYSIATGGSRIVHPAAIELAKTLRLDIRVRNFVHRSTPEGTLITSQY